MVPKRCFNFAKLDGFKLLAWHKENPPTPGHSSAHHHEPEPELPTSDPPRCAGDGGRALRAGATRRSGGVGQRALAAVQRPLARGAARARDCSGACGAPRCGLRRARVHLHALGAGTRRTGDQAAGVRYCNGAHTSPRECLSLDWPLRRRVDGGSNTPRYRTRQQRGRCAGGSQCGRDSWRCRC